MSLPLQTALQTDKSLGRVFAFAAHKDQGTAGYKTK
jgi:hypothetical protein